MASYTVTIGAMETWPVKELSLGASDMVISYTTKDTIFSPSDGSIRPLRHSFIPAYEEYLLMTSKEIYEVTVRNGLIESINDETFVQLNTWIGDRFEAFAHFVKQAGWQTERKVSLE